MVYNTRRRGFTTLESYHSSNYFIFHHDNLQVNREIQHQCYKVIYHEFALACMWLAKAAPCQATSSCSLAKVESGSTILPDNAELFCWIPLRLHPRCVGSSFSLFTLVQLQTSTTMHLLLVVEQVDCALSMLMSVVPLLSSSKTHWHCIGKPEEQANTS